MNDKASVMIEQGGDGARLMPSAISIAMPSLPSMPEVEVMAKMSEIAAASNFVNSTSPDPKKRAADAFFVMMYGRELGIPPMAALRMIYVIDGKPTCSGQAMLSLMRRAGMQFEIPDPHTITDSVTIRVKRPGGEWKSYTYTMEMARKAGLAGKATWTKYPREMLIWRATSMIGKMEGGDIIGGLYTIEEIAPPETILDEAGEIVRGELLPPPSAPALPPASKAPAAPPVPKPEAAPGAAPDAETGAPDGAINLNDEFNRAWLQGKLKKLDWHAGESPYYFAQIEPGRKLERFSDTTLSKAALEARLDAIGGEYKAAWLKAETAGLTPRKWDELAIVGILPNMTPAQIVAKVEAFTAAMSKQPPATPKKNKWPDADYFDMLAWIEKNFDLADHTALAVVGKKDWQEYPNMRAAQDALREAVYRDALPVKASSVKYVKGAKGSNYVEFDGVIPVRLYGRDKLRALSDDWAAYVDSWQAGNTYAFSAAALPTLLISYTKKDGYNEATDIRFVDVPF